MLKYKFDGEDNGVKKYLFFPEGHTEAPGVIVIKSDGTREIVDDSSKDFKRIYAMHALSGIDADKDEGVVAWY